MCGCLISPEGGFSVRFASDSEKRSSHHLYLMNKTQNRLCSCVSHEYNVSPLSVLPSLLKILRNPKSTCCGKSRKANTASGHAMHFSSRVFWKTQWQSPSETRTCWLYSAVLSRRQSNADRADHRITRRREMSVWLRLFIHEGPRGGEGSHGGEQAAMSGECCSWVLFCFIWHGNIKTEYY